MLLFLDNDIQALNVQPGTSIPVFTKHAALKFKKSEILYDIQNMAYVEGDIMPAEGQHERHQVIDIGEDGNIDRVIRTLNVGLAECIEMLYPYSKTYIDDNQELTDDLTSPEEYGIELSLPDDCSKSTLDLLEKYVHEYLVDKILADWMSITNLRNKDSAVNWQAKLDDTKFKIQTMMNTRIKRVRRKLSPL
jgi:hypothetical protein